MYQAASNQGFMGQGAPAYASQTGFSRFTSSKAFKILSVFGIVALVISVVLNFYSFLKINRIPELEQDLLSISNDKEKLDDEIPKLKSELEAAERNHTFYLGSNMTLMREKEDLERKLRAFESKGETLRRYFEETDPRSQ